MILGTLKLHESPDPAALLARAAELGVRALDTADVYGHGGVHGTERRIADLASGLPVQTKGGLLRTGPNWRPRGTAGHLTTRAKGSRDVLGAVPLYFLHVVDPEVGLDRSWRALQKLRADGVIGGIGLSGARYDEVRRALELGGLDAVQLELSPFKPDALEAGIVRLCHAHGVAVQAHSPLGGWRRKRRDVPAFRPICEAHGISSPRLTLRWLEALGVEPVVGCTRIETLEDALGPVPQAAIDAALEAIPQSRLAREAPTARGDGHVVVILGLPGAGKTTLARDWVQRGYTRFNRDELGGTLKGVVKRLDDALGSGARTAVLDNTWADRHVRNRLVMVAAKHGCRVEAVHVDTPFDQCLVQAARRILADGKGLPEPALLERGEPPHWFGPRVLFDMRRRFEVPTADEGFALRTTTAPPLAWGRGAATVASLEALEQRDTFDADRPLLAALWAPDPARRARVDRALERHAVLDHRLCTHPPGPARCWCRKPLPGMLVDLMLVHDLSPDRTVVVGGPAERTLAERVGARFEPL